MNFKEFEKQSNISVEEIARFIFNENREKIKIKKEAVAVKNLTLIFDSALDLASEKGFHTMSLRDLSSRSGLSMGALYSCFASKDELLDMVQTYGSRIGKKIIEESSRLEASPAERIDNAVRSHLYLSEILSKWFLFSYMETKNLGRDAYRKSIDDELFTEQIFIDILEEGKKNGDFNVENPVLTASVIKSMLQDWYLKRWKYRRRKITVDEYADFVVGFITKAIG